MFINRKKSCINNFNKRVSVLTEDKQVIKSINLIDKNIFCGDQAYNEFYNNINIFLLGLDDTQKKTFMQLCFLLNFTEMKMVVSSLNFY